MLPVSNDLLWDLVSVDIGDRELSPVHAFRRHGDGVNAHVQDHRRDMVAHYHSYRCGGHGSGSVCFLLVGTCG